MKLLLISLFSTVIAADLKYKTFQSPPIYLRSGQISNTPNDWGPLPWIDEPIVIRHFSSDVVDVSNKSVPESELYVHHWLIYNYPSNEQNYGVCSNLGSIFGIGAELRGVIYDFPHPYGVLSTDNQWTANLHFIRTTNVQDVQECIECRCPDSNPPKHPHGEVGCCVDRSQCWGMENSTLNDTKPYFLQYTIGYEPITDDIIPLHIFYFDVTALDTTDCRIQYDVPELKEGEIHTKSSIANFPTNMSVQYVELHQHIGGLNFTVDHFRNGKYLNTLCAQSPIYVDDYLTDIPTCHYPESYQLLEGDKLHITSLYTGRSLPGGHAWHSGVMGLAYIAGVADPMPKRVCLDRLHLLCGKPPYKTEASCNACGLKHKSDLMSFHCTIPMVKNECSKTDSGGNVPPPDEVHDMTMKFTPLEGDSKYLIDATGPAGSWFAFGFNTVPTMDGSSAFVFCNDDSGKPVLQKRYLGNHEAGKLVNKNFPCNVTTIDNIVTLSWIFYGVSEGKISDGTCFLFAEGSSSSMVLDYHGSTRGSTCI